jgi:subtilisin family serine protease
VDGQQGAHLRGSGAEDLESQEAGPFGADPPGESRELKRRNSRSKNRFVVRYKTLGGKEALLQKPDRRIYHSFEDENVIVVDLDDDEIEAMSLNEDIDAVEEDYEYEALGHFVRELDEEEVRKLGESVPYGITMVQANQVSLGPYGVKVCIADTGVVHHPDLPTSMRGADRTSSSGQTILWDGDKVGHGTHTAGTVAAQKGNDVGVVGVAPGASLYITRSLDNSGSARESDIYQAIKQCADSGAKVISLSLGGGGISTSFKSLIDNLYYQKNIVLVAGKIESTRLTRAFIHSALTLVYCYNLSIRKRCTKHAQVACSAS